jgi:hypothetical protein
MYYTACPTRSGPLGKSMTRVSLAIAALAAASCTTAYAQAGKATPVAVSAVKEAKPPDPNFVRWRVYLDTLAQEAKTVADERRPYVLAEVAAAYWQYDRDEARSLFTRAADEAWKLASGDAKYGDLMDDVLSGASRLDVELVRFLKKRLADKEG